MDKTLIEKWTTSMKARGLSRRTWTEWPATVRRCAESNNTQPENLSADQIIDWLADLDVRKSSKATYLTALRAWHLWLVQREYRLDDPTTKVGRIRAPRGRPRPTHTDHLARLLAWPGLRRRTRAMITLHAYEGMRCAEIAAVRGEHFDLIAQELTIHGKGDTDLVLPLHPEVVELAERMPRRGLWFPSHTRPGEPIRSATVSNTLSDAMRRAGIPGTAHALRHWFGTQLLKRGADMRVTQDLMRHSRLTSTEIYTETDDARRRAAIRLLPSLAAA